MKKSYRVLSLLLSVLLLTILLCGCAEKTPASGEPSSETPASSAETSVSASSETESGEYTLTEGIGRDQKIPFGDEKLEEAVRKALKITDGRDITPDDCIALIYLDIRNLGISNLDGLQYCRYLEVLYAGGNKITCLSAVAALPELFILDLSDNDLTDYSAIVDLENLMFVDLHGNHLTDTISPYVYFDEDNTYVAYSGQTVTWN